MVGRIIGGKYRILDHIGEGGQGAVFRAVEVNEVTGYEKMVAVKVALLPPGIPPQLAEIFLRKFREEATVMSLLSHQNLVQLITVIKEDGDTFLVMGMVDGTNLRKLEQFEAPPLSERIIAYVAVECCKALSYLHDYKAPDGQSLGIVHRDVSPQNILLAKDGGVLLADLGVVKVSATEFTRWRKETTGTPFIGNPVYAAIEQTMAKTDVKLDGRADQYSLALVIYEAATKELPFSGTSIAVGLAQYEVLAGKRRVAPITELRPGFSQAFADTIRRAMSIKREDRFERIEDFQRAIIAAVPDHQDGYFELRQRIATMLAGSKIVVSAGTEDTTERPVVEPAPAQAPSPPPAAAAGNKKLKAAPESQTVRETSADDAVPHLIDTEYAPLPPNPAKEAGRSAAPSSATPVEAPASADTPRRSEPRQPLAPGRQRRGTEAVQQFKAPVKSSSASAAKKGLAAAAAALVLLAVGGLVIYARRPAPVTAAPATSSAVVTFTPAQKPPSSSTQEPPVPTSPGHAALATGQAALAQAVGPAAAPSVASPPATTKEKRQAHHERVRPAKSAEPLFTAGFEYDSDQSASLTIEFQSNKPGDCDLFVDGVHTAMRGSGAVPIVAGSHRIRLQNRVSGTDKNVVLRFAPGQKARVTF